MGMPRLPRHKPLRQGGGWAVSAPRTQDDGYLSLAVFPRAGERMIASQRWEEESTAAGCILRVLEGFAP